MTLPKLLNGQDICKCKKQDGEACSGCGLGHSDWCIKSARQESADIAVSKLQYSGKQIQSVEQDDTAWFSRKDP